MKYNKAVRDKIPEIIKDSGRHYATKTLNDDEFLIQLEKKLDEEISEYQTSKSVEELADILEVVLRIAELRGADINKIRNNKISKCGKFEKNIFLIDAELNL